jgi:hypothetical protein
VRLALCALVAAAAAGAGTAAPPPGTFAGCPRDTRPLPAGPLVSYAPQLRRAVLEFVHTQFLKLSAHPPDVRGARVVQILLVTRWRPSGWIKTECGATVWRRSVAAVVYFPKLDKPHNPIGHCNDCAHITFLAVRTEGGWTVWGDY